MLTDSACVTLLIWGQWLWQCSGSEVKLLMVMTGGGSDSHILMVPVGIGGGEVGHCGDTL